MLNPLEVFKFILHVDKYLLALVTQFGWWTYVMLFLIVFAETGFVVTPFLPGDSLLFAVGALSALGFFSLPVVWALLVLAAILGDTVNYWIGHYFGQKLVAHPKVPINKKHIAKTEAFFAKHGGKAIILARFVPIVRTFAPFVAGIGKMNYSQFLLYNVVGGITWITAFVGVGYFFGNLPIIKENFSLVVIAIVILSVLPIVYELWKERTQPE